MKRIKLYVLSILLLFIMPIFICCLALPKPTETKGTLFVIRIQKQDNTRGKAEFFAKYKLYFEDKNGNIMRKPANPKSGYLFVDYLEPGEYKLQKIDMINPESGQTKILKLGATIPLKSGYILICPAKIFIELDIKQTERYIQYIQYIDLKIMQKEEIEEIKDYLSKFDNYSEWKMAN